VLSRRGSAEQPAQGFAGHLGQLVQLLLRVDAQQLEASLPRLQQQLAFAIRQPVYAARKVAALAPDLHRGSASAPGERARLFDAYIDPLHAGVNAEQHRRHLLGRHLNQVVAAKAEQRRHFVCHLVVVRRQADAPAAACLRDVRVQTQIEPDALLMLALGRANAHDTIELEPMNADHIHDRPPTSTSG